MAEPMDSQAPELGLLARVAGATSRRRFLHWAGVTFVVTATGCGKKGGGPTGPGDSTTFPNNDTGLLNYFFALEQLSAAFYTQAVASAYAGRTAEETAILTDIRDHELAHREFLRGILGNSAIGDFTFSFSSVNFADRTSTLTTARTLEDLAITAYNGGARVFANSSTMVALQKIGSVEGRHAAAIRDTIAPKTAAFAGDDAVNATSGLDEFRWPSQGLAAIDPYATTTFSTNLP